MANLRQIVSIDIGSSMIRIAVSGKGVAVESPAIVALRKDNDSEVAAIGEDAKEMIGKAEKDVNICFPVKNGVISHYTITVNLLGYLFDEAVKNPIKRLLRPDAIATIPCDLTSVEKRAVERCLHEIGAGRIFLVEAPLAAAVGAQLDVASPSGKMIVDIGAGVTDIAVISYNGIVACKSVPVGGNDFDEALRQYFRSTYYMDMGIVTAEKIKINNACAYRDAKIQPFDISAMNVQTKLPMEITVKPDETIRPLSEAILPILDGIRATLEQTPPELAADIFERGIILTGGSANLAGIDTLISKAVGIGVMPVDNPETCSCLGALKILESMTSDQKNDLMSK